MSNVSDKKILAELDRELAYKARCNAKVKSMIEQLEARGFECSGTNQSFNLYGCSIYFTLTTPIGEKLNVRVSDHDCQRAVGEYEKWSFEHDLLSQFGFIYEWERVNRPELFNWELVDSFYTNKNGKLVQRRRCLGYKA